VSAKEMSGYSIDGGLMFGESWWEGAGDPAVFRRREMRFP
jgi:hypothetical protein